MLETQISANVNLHDGLSQNFLSKLKAQSSSDVIHLIRGLHVISLPNTPGSHEPGTTCTFMIFEENAHCDRISELEMVTEKEIIVK